MLKTTDAGQETKEHILKENENVKDHCPDFHDTDKCEERINQDQVSLQNNFKLYKRHNIRLTSNALRHVFSHLTEIY